MAVWIRVSSLQLLIVAGVAESCIWSTMVSPFANISIMMKRDPYLPLHLRRPSPSSVPRSRVLERAVAATSHISGIGTETRRLSG